jgi:hypothetical protein
MPTSHADQYDERLEYPITRLSRSSASTLIVYGTLTWVTASTSRRLPMVYYVTVERSNSGL